MTILGRMTGMLGGLGGSPTAGTRVSGVIPYRKMLQDSDFRTADVTATADEWTLIGSYTVGAQSKVAWGYGSAAQPENQGYMYVDMEDTTGTDITGSKVRLIQENAGGTKRFVVFEHLIDSLRGSATDRTQQIPLPEKVEFPLVGQDSKLKIEVLDATANIYDYGECTISLPITVYQ